MVCYLVALGARGSLLPGVALGTEEGTRGMRREREMGHAATCVCPPRHPPGPTTSPFGGSIPAWVVQTGGDSGVRWGWRVAGASFGCWLHPCPQGTGLVVGGGGTDDSAQEWGDTVRV